MFTSPTTENIAQYSRREKPLAEIQEKTLAEAAEWYARNGFPVFPLHSVLDGRCSCGDDRCQHPGKHPRTPHGFKDASTDLAKVASYWQQYPNANIGLPAGAISGILVLDVDPRHGGDESLDALVSKYGPLPDTAQQATGGGGKHIVFRLPAGIRLPADLAPGIELKGDGRYIVAAPSVHSSGRRYQWDGLRAEHSLLSPAEVPVWLLELIQAPMAKNRTNGVDAVELLREGRRNNGLTSLAGSMRRKGMSQEAIRAALLEDNKARCIPPLPEGEVLKIADSISRYLPGGGIAASAVRDERPFTKVHWPDPIEPAAFQGIAGDFVRLIAPHTEADPAALLIQFLLQFGNVIGRGPHFKVGTDRHGTNLFALIVGATSQGRKGTSESNVRHVLRQIDATWATERILSGLSTGEGLIWAVRDPIETKEPIRENKRIAGYQQVITDEGVSDKRLLIVEPEFVRALQVAERETNTLSAVIRQAWDSGELRTLTKKQSAVSTGAHISIIGHITRDELRRYMSDTAVANGFANRFLWACARRSQSLPEGGALHTVDFGPLLRKLTRAAEYSRGEIELKRDEEARAIWNAVYERLSRGMPGMFGAVTSRAQVQVVRLAIMYALLDCSELVRAEHLIAALAVWQYCEASARYIFGQQLGDPTADQILSALLGQPEGMTRNEIRELFQRHRPSADVDRALSLLAEYGLATRAQEQTGGRPSERWVATGTGAR